MNLPNTLERLIQSELEYARFNACRTCSADEAGIGLDSNDAFASLCDPSRPQSSYYNRAVCRNAGSLGAGALALLPQAVQSIEVLPSALNEDAARRLLALGFCPAYALCYLGADPSTMDALSRADDPAEISIDRLHPGQVDEFLDLLQIEGADFPPDRRARKRRFYCTEKFPAFVARDATGLACAWATLYIHEGTAFLGNTYTRPEQRRRGCQGRLLAARARHAVAAGIQQIYTDVEFGSQSHRNCERAGMRSITVNTIWSRSA